jgi:hypothetical protein
VAPNTPSVSKASRSFGLCATACAANAVRASAPPSPRLSARRISTTYFSVTTSISAQKINEIAPMTLSGVGAMPVAGEKISLTV